MRYCFDIDGTICTPTVGRDYHLAVPYDDRIKIINDLYDREHYIIYFSARGMGRFGDDPDAPFKAEEILYDLTYDHILRAVYDPIYDSSYMVKIVIKSELILYLIFFNS